MGVRINAVRPAVGSCVSREDCPAGDVAGEEKEAKVVNVWKEKQPQLQLEASKEDEFDQYLSAMFL